MKCNKLISVQKKKIVEFENIKSLENFEVNILHIPIVIY